MILHCTFEELSALTRGAARILAAAGQGGGVAAPPEAMAELESFAERLDGDVGVDTLAEQVRVERMVDLILAHHRQRMDAFILEHYVGEEDATNAYFEYAHTLTVQRRVRDMGREMRAIAEVVSGRITPDVERDLTFPD